MSEDARARRLWWNGLALFTFGLAFGFVFKSLPNARAGLTAHLSAVQSGTFLVALGLLWPQLVPRLRAVGLLANANCVAFWLLQAGLTIPAFVPAKTTGGVMLAAFGLQLVGSVTMFVSVGALLVPMKRAR